MRFREVLVVTVLVLIGCRSSDKPSAPAPAKLARRADGETPAVTLTPEAETRLGIALASATRSPRSRDRSVGGDVLPSSGRSIVVVAPVAGRLATEGGAVGLVPGQAVARGAALARLIPVAGVDRDLRATADRTASVAEARLTAADQRLARAEKLLGDGAGSARAVEEARAEREVARAELEAGRRRLGMLERAPLEADVAVTLRAPEDAVVRTVSVGPSALVPAGAPLFELVGTGTMWVKATIFVGDLRQVRLEAPATVRPLVARAGEADVEALPISGPPTADPLTSSFDLYYALPKESGFRPGERVVVQVPHRTEALTTHVPSGAVVRDPSGAAWVYESLGPHVFARRRVEVLAVTDGQAWLSSGALDGRTVASIGAAELFGFELGGK